jgi:hypothetical protein
VTPGATVAVSEAAGATTQKFPVAVPMSGTLCGLLGALSVNVNVAPLAAEEFAHAGVNVTCIVHVPVGATLTFVPAQVFAAIVKSLAFVPVAAAELKARDPLPSFVIVTVTGELDVPTCWLPKLMLAGASETLACVPVPESEIA